MLVKNKKQKEVDIFNNMPNIMDLLLPDTLQEKKDYLVWYYSEVEYGHWKRCSRCGEYKLANNMFFSKNRNAKDGFYSICKECRNKKPAQEKRSE